VADVAGITREELQLAARNHGMPLEALRYDVTPPGLHYLLVHYDIPQIDADAWRLRVEGLVARPLEISLSDLRQRTTVTRAVTLECAGNGRALLEPRPLSEPWLLCCRATDSTSATQPLEPGWNVGGYANNAVQRVPILVR
jgi:sulfane dehydrogenase subunit SoxC